MGGLLQDSGPKHLYHYTGPAGLIGILNSKTLWAGRPADMNDASEQLLAQEYAFEILSEYHYPRGSYGEGMVQYALDLLSRPWRRAPIDSRAYTVSLTSEKDSLEQWRAYCPRSGGAALGFPVGHLRKVATEQGLILAPCVYGADTQHAIVEQVVVGHIEIWQNRRDLELPRQGISSHLVRDFIADLDRFAPLLKHHSFAAEREWRLVYSLANRLGPGDIIHVPSANGIKMYRPFSILTPAHPRIDPNYGDGMTNEENGFHVVLGPNVDFLGMEEAVRSLIPKEFGFQNGVPRTASPYR